MAKLTGLFERGGAYYLRVVLPLQHSLLDRYKSGKVVTSLGRCSHREALRLGTIKRAEILWGESFHPKRTDIATDIKLYLNLPLFGAPLNQQIMRLS